MKGILEENIRNAGVDQDEEVLKAAEAVIKQEDPEGFQEGKYNTNVTVGGDVKGWGILPDIRINSIHLH